MKIDKPLLIVIVLVLVDVLALWLIISNMTVDEVEYGSVSKTSFVEENMTIEIEAVNNSEIVYDGMTIEELSDKLDKSLFFDLENTGNIFARKCIDMGIDPYLAVAIVLHETGCEWGCSTLVKQCNNVGGMKGTPSCNGGSYASFDTLEQGIDSFIKNIYNNYYVYGLTTAETMNSKYAASPTWASKVNSYIAKIKAK